MAVTPLDESNKVHQTAAEIGKSVYCRPVFVRITDEAAVRAAGFVRQITVIDKYRIELLLRDGIEVKGAELVNDVEYTLKSEAE
jgi:hypothetical protein